MSGIEQATIASLGYETGSNIEPCSPTIAFPPVAPGLLPRSHIHSSAHDGIFLYRGRSLSFLLAVRSAGRLVHQEVVWEGFDEAEPKAHTHVLRLKT
jgi:hypothetical protein